MIIDFHAHIITRSYIQMLKDRPTPPSLRRMDEEGYTVQYGRGLEYAVDARMLSLERKLSEMDQAGVDTQVLSIAVPGVDCLEPGLAVKVARAVNDELSDLAERSGGRFVCLAVAPLSDVSAAVDEVKRSVGELGLRGVEVFSNLCGKPLDHPSLYPFYEAVSRLRVPVMVHPTSPAEPGGLMDYGLMTVVGFLFDSTLAVLRMVFSGLFERFPDLKVVLPHAGATIPYLLWRIDHQFRINPECRVRISRPPSEYLSRVYMDTAQNLHRPAMECFLRTVGPDRIVFGTDHPFANLKMSVDGWKAVIEAEEDREKVFWRNSAKILRLERA